jgi:hypothetical protein
MRAPRNETATAPSGIRHESRARVGRLPLVSIAFGPDASTRFLNVDLDLFSRSSLEALVDAFGKRVLCHYVGKEGRRFAAHLSLRVSGLGQSADSLLLRFAALVRSLPPPARGLWDRATVRQLNLGIQAAHQPPSFELPIKARTLAAVTALNAGIVVTIYSAGR